MESLLGAVVGGFLLAFVTVGLQYILPQNLLDFRQAFVFVIVILVLLFRPQGLIQGVHSRFIQTVSYEGFALKPPFNTIDDHHISASQRSITL